MTKPSEYDNLWKIVEEVRKSSLLETKSKAQKCQASNTIISNENIKSNIDKIVSKLLMNINDSRLANVTHETLEIAANMFTYLNHCPTKVIEFYRNLFLKGSPHKGPYFNILQDDVVGGIEKDISRIVWGYLKNNSYCTILQFSLKIFTKC